MPEDPISFRSSSLQAYELCPRMFGANYLIANELESHFCPDMRRKKLNIGAAIGTAVHDAHAFLMNALARTGEHGGSERQRNAFHVALNSYQGKVQSEGVGMDSTTPNTQAAESAIAKITKAMHQHHRPRSEPILIEKGFKASYRYRLAGDVQTVAITGTIDLYLLEELLPDLKTGRNRPAPYSQLGTYDNILCANGIPVSELQAVYIPRVSTRRQQPPPEIIPIQRKEAKQHAYTVASLAHRDVSRMLSTGDFQPLLPRTNHHLCDPRFCPAFGTKFCSIGAAVNAHKKEWGK